jgi:spermidine synthase
VTRSHTLILLITVTCLAVLLEPVTAGARIIHRERSLYSTILVDQRGSLVCLQFSVRSDQRNQSCKDLNRPRDLVFGYAKLMLTSLLLMPDPQRILVVGLGGGTLPMTLNELYPHAEIDVVEIDPAVLTVAETYFDFAENDQIDVIIQDARVFTKRAGLRGERYDLIMLDAFNGDYIPEHLMTREYLEETKALLSEDGVIVANTFAISRLYDHESTTYQAVFGEFFNATMPESANRIILTTGRPLPSLDDLAPVARELAPKLLPYGVRLQDYRRELSTTVDWDPNARILTDQYAPANLLQGQ